MLNVAIDLHETYDADPGFFNSLMDDLSSKVNFFILSGSPGEEITQSLIKFAPWLSQASWVKTGDHWSFKPQNKPSIGILSITDFCKYNQKLPMDLRTHPRTGEPAWYYSGHEELWWSMKAVMCRIYRIDLLIDDKVKYAEYFGYNHPTNFLLYKNATEFVIREMLNDKSETKF